MPSSGPYMDKFSLALRARIFSFLGVKIIFRRNYKEIIGHFMGKFSAHASRVHLFIFNVKGGYHQFLKEFKKK